MANYRMATLLASESSTTAGTKTIDVDLTDPISRIQIVHKATSAATAMANHIAANISKIELVDGSDVLASLSGKECQALDFYSNKVMPYNYLTDVTGTMAMATFNLNFGRKLWDPVLAVDPNKFRNLQLKITHNYRTCDTAASAATLEVYGFLFDKKKPTPSGFLMPKEVKSYTSGADASYEYTDLPCDHIMRKMLVLGNAAAYYPYQVVSEIRLSEDNDKSIPFDMSASAWIKTVNQAFPLAIETCMLGLNTTPRDVYIAPTFGISANLLPETVTNIISIERADPRNPVDFDITANDECVGSVQGFQPHGAIPLFFGEQDDPADWYDTTLLRSLKARVKAGSAGTNGSVQIVTEQLRKY